MDEWLDWLQVSVSSHGGEKDGGKRGKGVFLQFKSLWTIQLFLNDKLSHTILGVHWMGGMFQMASKG